MQGDREGGGRETLDFSQAGTFPETWGHACVVLSILYGWKSKLLGAVLGCKHLQL